VSAMLRISCCRSPQWSSRPKSSPNSTPFNRKLDSVKALQTETAAELDAMLPVILDKAFKGEL